MDGGHSSYSIDLHNLATSIADHSYIKHGHEFRNEKPDGGSRGTSPNKSYGDRLEINNREDLATHIKDTIQSPDTKYFIDEAAGGRMVFYNEKTGTTIIFNPNQLANGDGHAGTVFREKISERGNSFKYEIEQTTARLSHAPEIENGTNTKWQSLLKSFSDPISASATYALSSPPKQPGIRLPEEILNGNKPTVDHAMERIKIRGPSGLVLTAAGAGLIALAGGASAAEAGGAAVDSVAHYTAQAVQNGTSVPAGIALDGAAIVAPGTVAAAANETPSTLSVAAGIATDIGDTAACALGGFGGGAAGGLISSPTVLGVPVATAAGGVAGCVGGTYAIGAVRDGVSDFFSAVADFVSGETDELPPRTPETDKLMAEIKEKGAGYAPELAAIAEVWGSPKLTEQTLIGFREEGSHAELMQQIQAHLARIASQPHPAQTGLEQSAAAWAPPALQM